MIQKIISVLPVLLLASILNVNAQYDANVHRQTDQEIQKFKKERLHFVTISLSEQGNEVPYAANYYDTSGRVIMMVTNKHHEHFGYDNNGRMNYWLDSANDGRRFEKIEYNFGYDGNNRVNSYETNKTKSQFAIGGGQEVNEDVMKNGVVVEKHSYTYTQEGKLTLEVFKDMSGNLVYSHKILYNKYGDLASEIIINPYKNCKGDSTAIINVYNSKGLIVHKQKNVTNFSCGQATSLNPEKKTITNSIGYQYDSKDRLTIETLMSGDPTQNGRKEYSYNDDNLIAKEMDFDGKGASTGNKIYKYYFYLKSKR